MSPKKSSGRNRSTVRKTAAQVINELELQQIEALLGEDFESLAQAKRALQRETDRIAKNRSKRVQKQIKQTSKGIKQASKRTAKSVKELEKQAKQLEKQLENTRKKLGKELERLSKPAKKPAKKSVSKKKPVKKLKPAKVLEFEPITATRMEKSKYARKIGRKAYYKKVTSWWDENPDEDRDDNPYFYHEE